MNTLHNKYDAIENLIFNEGLRIKSLKINPNHDKLLIGLNTNLTFVTPIKSYKGLQNASIKDLKNFKLIAGGTGIYWPALDEDLSLKGFLKEFLRQKVNTPRKLSIA